MMGAALSTLKTTAKSIVGALNELVGFFSNGVANSAAKLATARKINGVNFDGTEDITVVDSSRQGLYFGTTSQAAGTVNYEVSVDSGFELAVGVVVTVIATVTATVAGMTLNVNGTGAKAIRYRNAATTTTTDAYVFTANIPCTFMYDGTYWQVVAIPTFDTNSTYDLATNNSSFAKWAANAADNGNTTYYALVADTVRGQHVVNKITATSSTSNTATANSFSSSPILIDSKIWFLNNTTGAVANGANTAAVGLASMLISWSNLRYSIAQYYTSGGALTTASSTISAVVGESLYVGGVDNGDGTMTCNEWSFGLRDTGKVYKLIGFVNTAAGVVWLGIENPVFRYDGVRWVGYSLSASASGGYSPPPEGIPVSDLALTQGQHDALDSGITEELVARIGGFESLIAIGDAYLAAQFGFFLDGNVTFTGNNRVTLNLGFGFLPVSNIVFGNSSLGSYFEATIMQFRPGMQIQPLFGADLITVDSFGSFILPSGTMVLGKHEIGGGTSLALYVAPIRVSVNLPSNYLVLFANIGGVLRVGNSFNIPNGGSYTGMLNGGVDVGTEAEAQSRSLVETNTTFWYPEGN
jgi:hypothetical protein